MKTIDELKAVKEEKFTAYTKAQGELTGARIKMQQKLDALNSINAEIKAAESFDTEARERGYVPAVEPMTEADARRLRKEHTALFKDADGYDCHGLSIDGCLAIIRAVEARGCVTQSTVEPLSDDELSKKMTHDGGQNLTWRIGYKNGYRDAEARGAVAKRVTRAQVKEAFNKYSTKRTHYSFPMIDKIAAYKFIKQLGVEVCDD